MSGNNYKRVLFILLLFSNIQLFSKVDHVSYKHNLLDILLAISLRVEQANEGVQELIGSFISH